MWVALPQEAEPGSKKVKASQSSLLHSDPADTDIVSINRCIYIYTYVDHTYKIDRQTARSIDVGGIDDSISRDLKFWS